MAQQQPKTMSEAQKQRLKEQNAPKRWTATLVALAIIMVISIIGFTPLGEKITQGLDIRGGVSVILTASKEGGEVTDEEMQKATAIIERRVNSLGASEATVQKSGANSILVQIPGATDSQKAIEVIGRTGLLEFVNVLDIKDPDTVKALESGKPGVKLKPGTYQAFMTGDSIKNVTVDHEKEGSPYYQVGLQLNDEGSDKFAQVSRELVSFHGKIAIVLDGVVDSAPAVQAAITDGRVSITGHYSFEQANSLKTLLDSGSLPVNLTFSESRVVGPTLGQESLMQGLMAVAAGFAIVALYLFFFYRGMGLMTAGSLAVFAVVYLGILAFLSRYNAFALSLPGLAGIVLTIGMAADSSILVLERFKEELRMGRSIAAASISGVRHGIGTSIDADVVSLVSAIALFVLAEGPVKGFGLTLALGIICDIITMLLFKAPLLRLLARFMIKHHPGFWGVRKYIEEGKACVPHVVAADGTVKKRRRKRSKDAAVQEAVDTQGGELNA